MASMIKQRQPQTNGKHGVEAGLDMRTAQPHVKLASSEPLRMHSPAPEGLWRPYGHLIPLSCRPRMPSDDDIHYFEHSGRRWRRSDPAIPESLRVELVRELMAARRTVGVAKRKGDSALEGEARARVQDAKVALGERGPLYWEPLDAAAQVTRAKASMRALLRSRAPGKTICPSDVARIIGHPAFRKLMPLVRKVAFELADQGELLIMQRGQVVHGRTAQGPIRIARVP